MCLAFYVASDTPLPEVPWSDRPAFNVAVLGERPGSDEVRRRLGKPHVYDVGAHTSCACGFTTSDDPERTVSLELLEQWLTDAATNGSLDVLVCWEGDEVVKPRRRTIRADQIADVDLLSAQERPLRLRVH